MFTVTVIIETTPEYFGAWLKDATRSAESFKFLNYLIEPLPADGGFVVGSWQWWVPALAWIEGTQTHRGPHELYYFDAIIIAPTRIKVEARSHEDWASAFDPLMARLHEELPVVRPARIVSKKPARIEAAKPAPAAQGTPHTETPVQEATPKPRTRGKSSATDVNAREAYRLYYTEGLTQQAIAERFAVSVKTVQRWLKRALKLEKTK